MIPFRILYKLKSIVRFNTVPRNRDETVAEHSYFVTLFAYKIARILGLSTVDICTILEMCIIHDIPEIWISDIPHPAKRYMNLDLFKKELETFGDDERSRRLFTILHDEDSLQTSIVRLADIISVEIYSQSEVNLGNEYFKDVLRYAGMLKNKIVSKYPQLKEALDELDNADDLGVYT